jgi:glucosamine--fructose-6-phosphate aminotransferase (isomerizing)
MIEPGLHTRREIFSQPSAWEAALGVLRENGSAIRSLFQSGDFKSLLFTGCGSTYYLALSAAATAQSLLGIPARGLPASEIWLNPEAYTHNGKTLLIAISRSGETTETLHACEAFRKHAYGEVLTLSCYPQHSLATQGTLNLVFPSGQETSIAQTRAFSTLYLATIAIAILGSSRSDLFDELSSLPIMGRQLLAQYQITAQSVGRDTNLDRFYFLGSGTRYGLACELSLKLKEMSLSHSEPFHFLEFRHGPKSMVTPSTLVVGLVSESHYQQEMAVLTEMEVMGAKILALGERNCNVNFNSGLSEFIRNVLYLPLGQQLAFERAMYHRLDPDQPHNLDAVVRLDTY